MKEKKRQAAIFLDRDGTINEEIGYMARLDKLKLIPGAAEAIRLINASGMKTVVVTNQSGIARGIFTESFVVETHAQLQEMLRAEGAMIDAFYFCPHHPTAGWGDYLQECECRKPSPGLLLRAAAELHLDPARSYMIGDTLNDMTAGENAGTQCILVRTGHGKEAAEELHLPSGKTGAQEGPGAIRPRPVHIANDLLAAVKWIMESDKP